MSESDGSTVVRLTADERQALGERIAMRRSALRLTQAEVAMRAGGVHKQTVWKWEHGSVEITLDNLRALADALQTTPAELLGGAGGAESQRGRAVQIEYGTAMYWLGRLDGDARTADSAVRQMIAVRDSIGALADLMRTATGGVTEFVSSGLLGNIPTASAEGPTPPPPPGGRPTITREQARAELDAEVARQRGERAASGATGAGPAAEAPAARRA